MKFTEVFKLDDKATIPTRNFSTDGGLDLYALEDTFISIGKTVLVKTGIAVKVPTGYVGLLRERSSIGKSGLKVSGGVIDALYAGDISVLLMNVSSRDAAGFQGEGYLVKAGDRVAQLLLVPIITPTLVEVKELWQSERSNKGFGSSGR